MFKSYKKSYSSKKLDASSNQGFHCNEHSEVVTSLLLLFIVHHSLEIPHPPKKLYLRFSKVVHKCRPYNALVIFSFCFHLKKTRVYFASYNNTLTSIKQYQFVARYDFKTHLPITNITYIDISQKHR